MRDNEKFIKEWEEIRQKGKFKYVLTDGMIAGIYMFIGTTVGKVIKVGFSDFQMEYLLTAPLGYFVGGVLGGVIVSSYNWSEYEDKYNDLKNENE